MVHKLDFTTTMLLRMVNKKLTGSQHNQDIVNTRLDQFFNLIDNQGQLLGAEGTNESSKKAAAWLDKNAHKYGFIVRYKPEFVDKTGYMEESWHIRYVGEDVAKTIYEKNISLEEYLNAPGGNYAN